MANPRVELTARGLRVFPLKGGAKAPPLVTDFPARATADPTLAGDLFRVVPPDANYGIHCAGLLVLDVDVRSGGDASFEVIEDLLPPTLTARTPSGGRHLFFRLPEGHPGVANSAGKIAPGIDVKSTRGYVVGVGSTTPDGFYSWLHDLPIADAPAWLVHQAGVATERGHDQGVDVPDAHESSVQRAREWLETQPTGEGAFATACGLRDRGMSLAQALELMGEHDPRPNVPEKVHHAYRYAQNAPGVLDISPDDFPVVEVAPPKPRKGGPQSLLELSGRALAVSPYLVRGLLSLASHAVLYGAPGQGKTFVALDIAYHVAAGRPWNGMRVAQGPALYLAYEGVSGLTKRAMALTRHYGGADVPLWFDSANYNLREAAGRKALGETIAALPERPALIVIDTLHRALMGGDENSAQDMGAMNAAVAALVEATGACVMLVHHSGKNKSLGARGSSALLGAIDTEIEVDLGKITPTKQRDVEICAPIGFQLKQILLGTDDEGDEVTSCVVVPVKDVPLPEGVTADRLKGTARRAFEVLCELRPSNEPVTPKEWLDGCAEFLSGRTRFYDATRALLRTGVIERLPSGDYRRKLE